MWAQKLNQHAAVTYDKGKRVFVIKRNIPVVDIFFVVLLLLCRLNIHNKRQSKTLHLSGALSYVFAISCVISCKNDSLLVHSERQYWWPKIGYAIKKVENFVHCLKWKMLIFFAFSSPLIDRTRVWLGLRPIIIVLTQDNLRMVPTNAKVCLCGYCYQNPKRKLGITTHFSKIINPQYEQKAFKYKAMYGVPFQIKASLSLKNAWLPPIFFLDTKSTF